MRKFNVSKTRYDPIKFPTFLLGLLLFLLFGGAHSSGAPLSAAQLIQTLQLQQHVEGGYFRRTFQADHRGLIDTPGGRRFTLTSIYYLLTQESPVGHWHLNRSDIVHYFHLGQPITYWLIHPDGRLEQLTMGPDPTKGQLLQLTVRGGTWKASHLAQGEYGLISEAVSPGFEYEDMMLGQRDDLLKRFPQHQEIIERFSR